MNPVQQATQKSIQKSILKRGWVILLAFAFIGLALYATALWNPFHYDDSHDIVKNQYINHIENLPKLFLNPIYASGKEVFTHTYRPFTYASYYLNYSIGGLNPLGYHLVNLGLHVGVTFLLYLITSFITGSFGLGWVAGIIFLVHPFNSEGVNYITARSSVMATFFFLLAFYTYMRFRPPLSTSNPPIPYSNPSFSPFSKGGLRGIYFWLGLSLLSFIFSMLSKEIAVTLPLILYVYEVTFRCKPDQRLLNVKSWGIPLLFLSTVVLPFLLLRIVFYGTPLVAGKYARDMAAQLATAPIVLIRMLQLIVFPVNLTIEHDIPIMHTIWAWPAIGALILVLGLVVVIVIGMARGGTTFRIMSFGVAWFFVTQLPTVIIPLNELLQENRGYLSMVGIVLTSVVGFNWLSSKGRERFAWVRTVQWGGVVLALFLFGGLTLQRNVIWKDDITLWRNAVTKSPDSAMAHATLGLAYRSEGMPGLALAEFRHAISLNPDNPLTYANLGNSYYDTGQFSEAEKVLLEALRRDPKIAEAHFNLGLVYKRQNRTEQAIQEFLKVVEEDQSFVEAYVVLGEEYGLQNRPDLVLYYFRKALAIDPSDALSRLNVAGILERQGDHAQAVLEYNRVMEQDPSRQENRFAIEKARDQLNRLKKTP